MAGDPHPRKSSRQSLPAKLPPADLPRWTRRHKVAVVDAVQAGIIGLEEACARYALSEEEFESWCRLADPLERRREAARQVVDRPHSGLNIE